MSLRDLLESGANVSVTVTLDDLRTIFHEAAKEATSAVQEQPAEEFLARKEVLALLKSKYPIHYILIVYVLWQGNKNNRNIL